MTERQPLIERTPTSYNDENQEQRPPSRLEWAETSWFRAWYVLCFGWIMRIFLLGYKSTLKDKDLDDLSYTDKAANIFNSVIKKFELTKCPIRTIIIKTVWKEFLFIGFLLIISFAARIVQPLITRKILVLIDQPEFATEKAYGYIALLIFCSVFNSFLFRQALFRANRVGNKVQHLVTIFIYRDLLSTNASVIREIDAAELLNLIAIDAEKFPDSIIYMHYLWEGPFEAIIAFILLWCIIGFLPALCGYLILICLIPAQFLLSKMLKPMYQKVATCTDKRLQTLREILNGCRIIKMYNWEQPMAQRVHLMRETEAKYINIISHIRAFNGSLFFCLMPVINLFTVGSSWLLNHPLTQVDVFIAMAIYGMTRIHVTSHIPLAIEKMIHLRVSMHRIQALVEKFENHRYESSSTFSQMDSQQTGGIFMRNASFSWKDDQIILKSLDITVKTGSLVSIVGPIGSGKSSLFAAILGEMRLIQDGHINTNGSFISYMSQCAWVFPDTIRANILFGRSFDAQRYRNILHACCLDTDLDMLKPYGDLTLVAEKGTNLSGGQKARISLARALYMDADIYLLDDPLASVDKKVAKEIYNRCIGRQGLFKNKTRLLVTHQMEYTLDSDQIIHLSQGQIVRSEIPSITSVVDDSIQKSTDSNLNDLLAIDKSTTDTRPIIEDETAVIGGVSPRVWMYFFNNSVTSCYQMCFLIILLLTAQMLSDGSNIILSIVSRHVYKDPVHMKEYVLLYIYIGLVIATVIVGIIRSHYFFYVLIKGANRLHDNMVNALTSTSLRFYESNPSGRILNRASHDQHVVDQVLPIGLFDAIQALLVVLGLLTVLGVIVPWALLIILPYLVLAFSCGKIYMRSNFQLKRLDSMSRSPIYTVLTSTLDGVFTIRASKTENYFFNLLFDRIDAKSRAYITMVSASNFFSLFLDIIATIFAVGMMALAISIHDSLNESLIPVLFIYLTTTRRFLPWGVQESMEAQILMTSVERIHEYTQLPDEQDSLAQKQDLIETPNGWPQQGCVTFRDYELRYRSSGDSVLKGINLHIEPNEKIGIIGRTGAGKSSLFQGLFRFVDQSNTKGDILIDNVDINRIRLQQLRSQLSIIPQQPALFKDTLRFNLDPCNMYTDEECWKALEIVQLKTMVSNHAEGLLLSIDDEGSNLSVGQCQLVCAARAILKKTKILLIDEATANVDTETDAAIQEILFEKIKDRTVLTIAHRLNTVVRSDRIVVLDMGRIVKVDSPSNTLEQNE